MHRWLEELGMVGLVVVVLLLLYTFINTNFLTYLQTQWTQLTSF